MRALGIVVGVAKGLDLVLLEQPRSVLDVRPHVAVTDLATLIAELKPDTIAIDSPPCFPDDAPRRTEDLIRKRGISLYATPWQEEMKGNKFYEWMQEGFNVFAACELAGFPLFKGDSYVGSAFEVYPYSVAVVLSGALRPKDVRKQVWRRGVLEAQGVTTTSLRNGHQIDAALAGLTGLLAIERRVCWQGEPSEGVIVLPRHAEDLKAKYLAP